jgi:hypothetical protein
MKSAAMSVDWQAKLQTKQARLSKIPCIFPASREFRPETGSQQTGSSATNPPDIAAYFWFRQSLE